MIGIPSYTGSPLPIQQRFALYAHAGISSLILWWGKEETASRAERVETAKKYALHIEHAHAATDSLNALWLSGEAGDTVLAERLEEIEDCARLGVGTLVLHLTNGPTPPPVSEIGMERVRQMTDTAGRLGVRLAFENMRLPAHTVAVLDYFALPHVGLCYDSGHEHLWTPSTDWLTLYSRRIFAIHLHDNNRDADAHNLPFDGGIDWKNKTHAIAAASYRGSVTVEAEYRCGGIYEVLGLSGFLKKARQSGECLNAMIEKHRNSLQKNK